MLQNFPVGINETIADEAEQLVSNKPNCLLIHVAANDLSKQSNSLHDAKKIKENAKKASQNTRVFFFSNLVPRKGKPNSNKRAQETNGRLKNYRTPKISILLRTIIQRKNNWEEKKYI